MAKHIIFFVHGMGNFEPGWSSSVVPLFKEQFAHYRDVRERGAVEMFDFREVTYNGVFEQWRAQWRTDAAAAAKALVSNGAEQGAASDLANLAGAPAGDGFWRTHALDVLLFQLSMQIAEEVSRIVQTQILDVVRAQPNDVPAYSIVAHSLGSAVIYEGLHRMLTTGGGLGGGYRPVNLFLIANTARLLWNRGGTCYQECMAPDIADEIGSCTRMMDVAHALDPVAMIHPFDPPPTGWFGPTSPPRNTYRHVQLAATDIQSPNVHALEHYLRHPDVHVPMIDWLTQGAFEFAETERTHVLSEWRQVGLMAAANSAAKADAARALRPLLNNNGGASLPRRTLQVALALRQIALAQPKLADGES